MGLTRESIDRRSCGRMQLLVRADFNYTGFVNISNQVPCFVFYKHWAISIGPSHNFDLRRQFYLLENSCLQLFLNTSLRDMTMNYT